MQGGVNLPDLTFIFYIFNMELCKKHHECAGLYSEHVQSCTASLYKAWFCPCENKTNNSAVSFSCPLYAESSPDLNQVMSFQWGCIWSDFKKCQSDSPNII